MPRIVPRVMVEMQQPQAFVDMLTGLKTAVIRLLAQECKHSKLDGMVRGPIKCFFIAKLLA